MKRSIPVWACLVVAAGMFVLGVLGGLAVNFYKVFGIPGIESSADVRSPKKHETERYTVEMPGNWSPDQPEPSADPEFYFTVHTPGDNFWSITIDDLATDPQQTLESYLESYQETYSEITISDFSSYGKLDGVGKILIGRAYGVKFRIRLFVHAGPEFTVIIAESCDLSDLPKAERGFALIEKSLVLKTASSE